MVDAVAGMRVWAVQVDLGARSFVIPALPAVDWFEAVLSEEVPLPIVPGLLGPDDEDAVNELLLSGAVSVDDVVAASRDALAACAGRSWWEADRLVRGAGAEWQTIGGELIRLGVDMHRLSLAAVLNAIYVICVRTMDEKQRTKFDVDLRQPPGGVPTEQLYDQRAAEDAFLALMGGTKPPVP